jgi:hypothetical protein
MSNPEKPATRLITHLVSTVLAVAVSILIYGTVNAAKDIAVLKSTQFGLGQGLEIWKEIAAVKETVAVLNTQGAIAFREFVKAHREEHLIAEKKNDDQHQRIEGKLDLMIEAIAQLKAKP